MTSMLNKISLTGYFVYGLLLVVLGNLVTRVLANALNVKISLSLSLVVFLGIGITLLLVALKTSFFKK